MAGSGTSNSVENKAVENKASSAASVDWQKFLPSNFAVENASADEIASRASEAADAARLVAAQAKQAAQKLHEQLTAAAEELQAAAEELKKQAAGSFNAGPESVVAVNKKEQESIVEPEKVATSPRQTSSTSSVVWGTVCVIALVVASVVYVKRRNVNDGYEAVPSSVL